MKIAGWRLFDNLVLFPCSVVRGSGVVTSLWQLADGQQTGPRWAPDEVTESEFGSVTLNKHRLGDAQIQGLWNDVWIFDLVD
ncbi:MAG: hypothetical protein MRY59_09905 [Aquisalinus sp.]|nr:hypothetical protein [Aquisalinus sp.]